MTSTKNWHIKLEHADLEAIAHLFEIIIEAKLNEKESSTTEYEIGMDSKTH